MANTLQIWKELQAMFIGPINIKYTRPFMSKYIHEEFTFTVHNFHQFEKVEWKKLVRAEIKVRKYVLGQRRKSPSNNGALSKLLQLSKDKDTAFSFRYLFSNSNQFQKYTPLTKRSEQILYWRIHTHRCQVLSTLARKLFISAALG